jgi:DNA polymerase-3 subunit epsilon
MKENLTLGRKEQKMIKKLFLDLETSGLDPQLNAVLEIGCIIEYKDVYKELNFFCQPFPNDLVDSEALDVNKLTEEKIRSFPTPKKVYNDLTAELATHIDKYNPKDKFVLLGYNVGFDAQFLRSFWMKNQDKYFGSWFWYPPLDVMALAMRHILKHRDRSQMKDFKLMTVAEEFSLDVNPEQAHGALYDVCLTRDLYRLVN